MMKDLGELIKNPGVTGLKPEFRTLSDIISVGYNLVLIIAGFLAFFWLVWGAFEYILAKGDKENLAKARARITWAIVGLIFIILAYFIATLGVAIMNPKGGTPL